MPQPDPPAFPRTKIVATIGPSTAALPRIGALLDAGIDVARINCAHGSHEELAEMVRNLRAGAERKDAPLAILADLAGPKLRLGKFRDGEVRLEKGAPFALTTDDVVGTAERASVNYAGLLGDVHAGDVIFLNDGMIRLVVTGVQGKSVHTEVRVGGRIGDRKGLSVPAAAIQLPSVTEKDWRDLDFLLDAGVDYIGLSFVRSEDDVLLLRRGMKERGRVLPIVAKIEKAQAVSHLEAIAKSADAVMVARGDLGVECPIEKVPVLQKRIIRLCRDLGTPVITATQMLESMVESPRPTRAEASDVANAVLDGTDAVMLSAETATGKYPIETVEVMRKIIIDSEAFGFDPGSLAETRSLELGDALGRSAVLAAESIQAKAIVCLTQSGTSARRLARWRPQAPIFAVTPQRDTWRRLALVRGVAPVRLDDGFGGDFDRECGRILDLLRRRGHVAGGDVVITAGLPFAAHGHSNTIRIETDAAHKGNGD